MSLNFYTDYRLGGIPRHYISDEEDRMIIPPESKKCVVFLCFKDQHGLKFAGTGFFVGQFPDPEARLYYVWLVTAKHVIVAIQKESIDGKVYVRINQKQGGAALIETDVSAWGFHPNDTSVDVAAIIWHAPANGFDYLYLPTEMAITDDVIRKEGIGAGSQIFMVGLYVNHYGNHKNLPIIRAGNIALMFEEKIDTKHFGSMEAHLVEVKSIGGLSGSPVFVYPEGSALGGQVVTTPRHLYLLGLMHGHWESPDTAIENISMDMAQRERLNVGIGIVVPVSKILETILQPEMMEIIMKEIKEQKEKNLPVEDTLSVQDTAKSSEKGKDGITKEEFEDALKKISRPVKKVGPKKKGT